MNLFGTLRGKKSSKTSNFVSERVASNLSTTYTGVYTFAYPSGFIKICVGTPSNNIDPFTMFDPATNIKINRVSSRDLTFKIAATLDKNLYKIMDRNYKNSKSIKPNWLPWIDDAEYINDTDNKYIRGGNRLEIMIQCPGEYILTIPDDVDLILEIDTGNISYVGGSGEISVTATDVSRCGSAGSFVNRVHQWEYTGDKKRGYAVLITHKGRVDL